ncbi:MAG: peptidoglycan DD-metalloendopeptidase family protein [Candidatus Saccharimonadales bacterium]
MMQEPLKNLFNASKLLILNFDQIPDDIPASENIQHFFEQSTTLGIDPKTPNQRQQFNNQMIKDTGRRYIVSRYGEDRRAMLAGSSIAKEGRTIHLGVDIFSKNLEAVYAPCDGEVICYGQEPESHSFGHYLVFKPSLDIPYIFFAHLDGQPKKLGAVKAGDQIAKLGDYETGENGGWSRHLHLQMMTKLSPNCQAPLGYASQETFPELSKIYPSPMTYFPKWKL